MADLGQRDILLTVAKNLNKYHIPYLLTGSFAVSYYGIPRATHDIDFVIEIDKENLDRLNVCLKRLNKDYLFDELDLKNPQESSFQFNIFHPETGIKVDFWMVKKDEFEESKFKRKKEIVIGSQKISLISPEDLILNKLLWNKKIISERHAKDCEGILKIQESKLDYDYLKHWAEKLKVTELLDEISHFLRQKREEMV